MTEKAAYGQALISDVFIIFFDIMSSSFFTPTYTNHLTLGFLFTPNYLRLCFLHLPFASFARLLP